MVGVMVRLDTSLAARSARWLKLGTTTGTSSRNTLRAGDVTGAGSGGILYRWIAIILIPVRRLTKSLNSVASPRRNSVVSYRSANSCALTVID